MIDRLMLNINPIIKKTLDIGSALFGLIAIILSFASWDDFGIKNMCYRISILISIIAISFFISAIYIIYIKNSNVIWKCGKGRIIICYSDIIKKGFQRKVKDERIVVIPVNTCFDTIVDNDVASVDKPLISPKSIHGQWVASMNDAGTSQEDLNQKNINYLVQKNILPVQEITSEIKKRRNLLSYERGTVVAINGSEKITFFLLALAEFDDNNKGQCTIDQFVDCVKKLIEFYNDNGQGFEIYLPLMGTNLSRVGMSHSEALHKIKAVFELFNDKIYGEVNIIVYNGDKKEVSIFD